MKQLTLNRWYSYAMYARSRLIIKLIQKMRSSLSGTRVAVKPQRFAFQRVKSDKLYIRILGTTWVELGAFDKDQWHAYVMQH